MAESKFQIAQYFSTSFVEIAGAVLFYLSRKEICILRILDKYEYVLPKGRVNIGESRQSATVREVLEETGYTSRILPLKMLTRNPPATEDGDVPDEAHWHADVREPFALQIRKLDGESVELI